MRVLETERLYLRWLEESDAAFILDLLNQPSWLEFIGDRGVRNLDDARAYISNGPMAMIKQRGFGLYLVETKARSLPIGLCGLIKRDSLDDVDIGLAFHPTSWGYGYAKEAAAACVDYASRQLNLKRLVAITLPTNLASIKLLEAIGLAFEKNLCLSGDDEVLQLFARELA